MKSPHWEDEDFRIVIGSSKIDYDQNKELYNRKNHKFSLESAVHLFEQLLFPFNIRPCITREAKTKSERRHEHITVDDFGDIVFIVTTMREEEVIRVISLRRAHEKERDIFISLTGYEYKMLTIGQTAQIQEKLKN